jgi:transposase
MASKKGYPLDKTIVEMAPSSALQLGAASVAFARWKKFDKERWKGTMSLPSFGNDSPIYISGAGVNVRVEDGRYIAALNLIEKAPRIEMSLALDGGSVHAHMRRVILGEAKLGDAKIIYVERKKKWMLLMSVTWQAPAITPGRTMALHRGIRSFLTLAIARGNDPKKHDARTMILETGEDVVRHKQAYTARRRSLGQQRRQQGQGAHGHGIARAMQPITRLEDAEARWVRSKCQEIASHACKMGESYGVTRVLLEDWTNPAKDGAPELGEHVERLVRTFPFRQLRDAIEWAARKRGWTIVLVKGAGESRDCPNCGHTNEVTKSDLFRCKSCQLERPVDYIAVWNLLVRDGKTAGIAETTELIKRKRAETRPQEEV